MLLSHALERDEDVSFKRSVVTKLAAMEYPHKIKNIPEFALEVLEKNTSLLETLPKEVKKAGRVGYVESESSSGTIASLIITACDVDVGISYKCILERNVCDVSIRGAGNLRLDLGKLASRISEERGGFGGGHPKASGARVPYAEIQSFVQEFAENVNSQLGS
jgi:single-stranded DNA-specific DHH superfamily exonuclease